MTSLINSLPQSPFLNGPSPVADLTSNVTSNLEISDILKCSLVSKNWNNALKHCTIWLQLFDAKKIPRIAGRDDTTAKEDFLYMYPRTVSAGQMTHLGRFVGIVPAVDPVKHKTFKTAQDAYDPTQKMAETWTYVVQPSDIHRDYDEQLLEILKAQGDFNTNADVLELEEKGLLIPFTFRNLVILANYVGVEKGIKPFSDTVDGEVLNQCSRVSSGVRVTQMRKEVPESTRGKRSSEQRKELAKQGHKVVDLETRAFYNVVNILNKRDCPDRYREEDSRGGGYTFSRTSTEIKIPNETETRFAVIGGFYPRGNGLQIDAHDIAKVYYGAAPIISAEVRSDVSQEVRSDVSTGILFSIVNAFASKIFGTFLTGGETSLDKAYNRKRWN